jgi:molybdopterin converting factor small subunit
MNTTVEIKLFATLRTFTPADASCYEIEPGICVSDLISALKIPMKEAKLIFINGSKGSLDTVLKGGERIGIFPPVGGG